MTNKTKRILVIAAGCVLCAAAVIGISTRFDGNAVIPSGTVPVEGKSENEVQVEVDKTTVEPVVNINPQKEEKPAGADAVDTGVDQTIQPDPVKPTEPPKIETPQIEPNKGDSTEQSTPTPPPSQENPPVIKPERTEPEGGSTNEDGQVYVPGFGWMTSTGEGSWSVSEGMKENGNKVGIMD